MAWDIIFEPFLPIWFLWLAIFLTAGLTVSSLFMRQRGMIWRGLTLSVLILTLANPSILEEERDPINDVVAIVVDRSISQSIGNREAVTDAGLQDIKEKLSAVEAVDLREISAGRNDSQDSDGGTKLFTALKDNLIDVPPERIAGAVIITDGQIHDVPQDLRAIGIDAPVHVLLSGEKKEQDRKLTIETAPRYGIVGETIAITVKVDDFVGNESNARKIADVKIKVDGEDRLQKRVLTGLPTDIELEVAHGGQNVIEVEVSEAENELTLQNNRAVVLINGIRDHLRVLLVSGEPHAGERTWRNLLKADPSVDLVHFTILRPPEKQDGTPIGELSLIEFPTRELFDIKLEEFDLIIFDRYKRRGVLPQIYLDNVARYVEGGGALLTAAGPAFSTPFSLYRTPLSAILPARPTGEVLTEGYKPLVTDSGLKHPVTARLSGAPKLPTDDGQASGPNWGRWFRLIDTVTVSGETIMSGPSERPLLVLDRIGDGRIAQLMSDQAWLWTRGYEGGGPQAEMLRRLAHWLMKEPDLEEEDLRATVRGQTIEITRHTMSDFAGAVTVTSPSGKTQTVTPTEKEPGIWTANVEADELGLYRLNDLTLTTVTGVGPLNPLELSDVRTTDARVQAAVEEIGGGVFWIAEKDSVGPDPSVALPNIRFVKSGRDTAGRNWIGFERNDQYLVRSLKQTSLMTAALALALILGALVMGWYREGR